MTVHHMSTQVDECVPTSVGGELVGQAARSWRRSEEMRRNKKDADQVGSVTRNDLHPESGTINVTVCLPDWRQ